MKKSMVDRVFFFFFSFTKDS